MKIRIVKPCRIEWAHHKPGDSVEVSAATASQLIAGGWAAAEAIEPRIETADGKKTTETADDRKATKPSAK